MAYFEAGDFENALSDANKCIEIDQDFVKGHFRKGMHATLKLQMIP